MITDDKLSELDDAIAHEKRVVAREVYSEAWADGIVEGIDTDILAEAAIATAFEEIIRVEGEHVALKMVESLRDRIMSGEFARDRTLQ